jgi:hypothetical protein
MLLDNALEIAGIALELGLVALLSFRRVYRTLPVFYLYLAWGLASDSVMLFLQNRYPASYLRIFVGEMSFDTVLQFAVLVELAGSVLRPYRASLPRGFLAAIPLALAAMGVVVWPFTNARGFDNFTPLWHFLTHLLASIAVLRVLFFMLLAGGSHLLSIGWRDRELQVATGLGMFSMVSLAASIAHSYQKSGYGYHVVDLVVSASYAVSIVYWIASFIQKEVPRREFNAQMRSLFPVLAGAARAQVEMMASSAGSGSQQGE